MVRDDGVVLHLLRTRSSCRLRQLLGQSSSRHRHNIGHCRDVFFHNHRCTLGMACAQAVAMRAAPSSARRLAATPRNHQPFRFDPHVFDRDFSHLDDGV